MAARIENYAMIGDCHTVALVAKNTSIDWFCVPKFHSDSIFGALLGTEETGFWRFTPKTPILQTTRRYRRGTLILETQITTQTGAFQVTDFMPLKQENPTIIRKLTGLDGEVELTCDILIRFAYGKVPPWITYHEKGFTAVVGPDALEVFSPIKFSGDNLKSQGRFSIKKGEELTFHLSWHSSFRESRALRDTEHALKETEKVWLNWIDRCRCKGPWKEAVERSLLTLKALIYVPTGAIIAAPTTSLPEKLGASNNWDYRYCWLRDASYTLYALLGCGCEEEAKHWSEWLLKIVGGDAAAMAVLYSVDGDRLYRESEVPWLCGYENSAPVRIGNEAVSQFQLDIYGEVIEAFYFCRRKEIHLPSHVWDIQKDITCFVEKVWDKPDEGIWEKRDDPKHNTHSKVLAWVALDRTVKSMESCGLEGPLDRFKKLRDKIHAEVCDRGFNSKKNSFTVAYGSKELDGSLLLLPQVGFLPIEDPRIQGTIEAIGRELCVNGFIARYRNSNGKIEGEEPGEGVFLITSFWYLEDLILMDKLDEARLRFERLLSLCNDVGLLSEEYDVHHERLLGNFPQALSHLAIINAATALTTGRGAVQDRSSQ